MARTQRQKAYRKVSKAKERDFRITNRSDWPQVRPKAVGKK